MATLTLGAPLAEDLLLAVADGAHPKLRFGREAQARVRAARATVETIASSAGVSNGLLYQFFASVAIAVAAVTVAVARRQ